MAAGFNGAKLRPFMEEGERFVTDALARAGGREGRLFLTNQALWFWPDRQLQPTARIALSSVVATDVAKVGRLGIRGLNLHFSDGRTDSLETSKRMAPLIAEAVSEAEASEEHLEKVIASCAEACKEQVQPTRGEGAVGDSGLETIAYLSVGDESFAWAPVLPQGITVLSMNFRELVKVQVADNAIRLTSRNADYAASLAGTPLGASNPYGEVDAELVFGDRFDLRDALLEGFRDFSPEWQEFRDRVDRFIRLANVPVAEWPHCPFCERASLARAEGAVSCETCQLYFSDPDRCPEVSEETATYGEVIGSEPYAPVFEDELPMGGKRRIWLRRPKGAPGPIVLPHGDAEQRAIRVMAAGS